MTAHFNKLIWLMLIFLISCSPASVNETEKIATFSKVWGFLKYHHPSIAKGEVDWDLEFIEKLDTIKQFHSKKEFNGFLISWIDGLGEIEKCVSCDKNIMDSSLYNHPNEWIHDSDVLTEELIKKLDYIQSNRNQNDNFYVSQHEENGNTLYTNEKQYKDSLSPSLNLRLLGLARYWNIINYFFPYKHLIDDDWEVVLQDMIPTFINATNIADYQLAVLKLCAKINDSHAYVLFDKGYTDQFFGNKYVPFSYTTFKDKIVVTGFYDDSLSKVNDIRHGDVFTSIDGKSVAEWINYFDQYYGSSNKSSSLRDMEPSIFKGKSDSVQVIVERDDKTFDKVIKRYLLDDINFNFEYDETIFKMMDGNIGYVNMDLLYPEDVKQVMDSLKNTKSIIFDVRNHSSGGSMYDVSRFLNPQEQAFAKFTIPDLNYPGLFKYTDLVTTGTNNEDYYKGKVILLCNEWTQSHAEFTLMALQTAPNAITIGSQTAGADGDVSEIPFPGGIRSLMSGIGVYYPDGKATQRVGIVPDIKVQRTVEGIQQQKDEILEKALEIARKPDL